MMLRLYKPALEEMWFRQELLSDPDTMSYNHAYGGVISFPKEKWQGWYHDWLVENENKRFYRYLLNMATNQFIGEAAYYLDDTRSIYICDIIVYAKYRGNGYGTEGLLILCEAAKENGIDILYDDIASDNPSVQLFLNNGFTIDFQTDDVVMVKRVL